MSKETNKQAMSQFVQFINTADPQLADQLISPKAIFYVPGRTEPMEGPQGYLTIIAMMPAVFPIFSGPSTKLLLDDDKAAARFTMTGTHRGPFFGVPADRQTNSCQGHQYLSFFKWPDHRRIWPTRPARADATDRCTPSQ